MSGGPATWTDLPFRQGGIYLDGTLIEGGMARPLMDLTALMGCRVLVTAGGTGILQRLWLGGKAPVDVVPFADFPMQMNVRDEADYRLFLTRKGRSMPVELWADWPLFEQWYIPARASGQTEWETRWKLPWSLPGVSHATRPPRVYVDDVQQTVLTSGTPSAGEVVVPEAGGYGTLVTPVDLDGTWLRLEYAPVLIVYLAQVKMQYARLNDLVFNVDVSEHVGRRFA